MFTNENKICQNILNAVINMQNMKSKFQNIFKNYLKTACIFETIFTKHDYYLRKWNLKIKTAIKTQFKMSKQIKMKLWNQKFKHQWEKVKISSQIKNIFVKTI